MKRQKRTCIYPKDIQIITGRSERYGRKLLRETGLFLNKKSQQFVTIHEFSEYTGNEHNIINEYILD